MHAHTHTHRNVHTHTYTLKFVEPGFNITPSESTPILGKSYSLTFFLTGAESLNFITAISYRWTRDSTVVGNGSATLTFDPLLLSDSGQYKYEVTVMVKSRPETIIFLGEFDVAIPSEKYFHFVQSKLRNVCKVSVIHRNLSITSLVT